MAYGCLGQQWQCGIIEHFAAGHENAAVAVLHVFAQAYVGDDIEFGPAVLDHTHGLLHDAVFVIRARGVFVLEVRNAKQDNGLEARIHGFFHLFFQLGKAELELAGHGADFFAKALVFSFHHKVGHDQVFNKQGGGFAHEGTEFGGGAQTAASMECGHGCCPLFCGWQVGAWPACAAGAAGDCKCMRKRGRVAVGCRARLVCMVCSMPCFSLKKQAAHPCGRSWLRPWARRHACTFSEKRAALARGSGLPLKR